MSIKERPTTAGTHDGADIEGVYRHHRGESRESRSNSMAKASSEWTRTGHGYRGETRESRSNSMAKSSTEWTKTGHAYPPLSRMHIKAKSSSSEQSKPPSLPPLDPTEIGKALM